ncbi:type II toxin-antitoxin system Phd/YefM family antitoxin [Acidobacteria bacterium AH-259-G07]|nr:type II toxin-antitoxin system Phd/YefM family antitoxin [Acidobacteria bacterium AH-259-G07]
MKVINFTEFRKNASSILSEVEMGETVQVLRHGKAIAEIVPVSSVARMPSWKRPGLRLEIKRGSLSQAIIDERRQYE